MLVNDTRSNSYIGACSNTLTTPRANPAPSLSPTKQTSSSGSVGRGDRLIWVAACRGMRAIITYCIDGVLQ